MAGDVFDAEVQVFEDRLVEFASDLIAGTCIELSRVREQAKAKIDVLGAVAEGVLYRVQLPAQVLPLLVNLSEFALDLDGSERAVCGEIEEVLFLGIESAKLIGELLAVETSRGRRVSQ
ncbi:hypothetical protein ACFUEJ_18790 [Gordonia sp. NPDC057258]|uniref:hypothetical protein n=1 Tax=unclassified Gordonia (in: high G+C Gram-positive bacteria) TaxID=2657482 RepID=UPI00362BFE3C